MASKQNPVPLVTDTGLGNVEAVAAIDPQVITLSTVELQARYVAQHARLTPAFAGVVANLFFRRVA